MGGPPHCELDYCNSLFSNIDFSQIKCLMLKMELTIFCAGMSKLTRWSSIMKWWKRNWHVRFVWNCMPILWYCHALTVCARSVWRKFLTIDLQLKKQKVNSKNVYRRLKPDKLNRHRIGLLQLSVAIFRSVVAWLLWFVWSVVNLWCFMVFLVFCSFVGLFLVVWCG